MAPTSKIRVALLIVCKTGGAGVVRRLKWRSNRAVAQQIRAQADIIIIANVTPELRITSPMEQPAASPLASALACAVVQHCFAFKGSWLCLAACA